MLFGVFSKITQKDALTKKIVTRDSGIYLYILFPIAVAFLITFIGARIISYINPDLSIPILYFTQLLGLSLGLEGKALGLGTELVSAADILAPYLSVASREV